MILIPVKHLKDAKQRLSPVLDRESRFALAQAMLQDVLETLGSWPNCPEVAVVSSDPVGLQLARSFDFQVILDQANLSETDAIERATQICESRGIENTLVIPGDIPLISAWELEKIFEASPNEGSVLVPAADGRGTNAVLRRPAGLFPLRFGNDSFKPHLAAVQVTRKPCVVLSLPGIALDVDSPADLKDLANSPGETRAQRLVRRWDFADYLLAVNG